VEPGPRLGVSNGQQVGGRSSCARDEKRHRPDGTGKVTALTTWRPTLGGVPRLGTDLLGLRAAPSGGVFAR